MLNHMTNNILKLDNSVRLQMLENEKKELNEKIKHWQLLNQGWNIIKIQELEDELFEVNDTIKKLNA